MKNFFCISLSVVVAAFAAPANSQDSTVPSADPDKVVTCANIPNKGFKCSDGYKAAAVEPLNGWTETQSGQPVHYSVLEINTRVDVDTCYMTNNGKYGWSRDCLKQVLPFLEYVTVPAAQCAEFGHLLAHRKWRSFDERKWRSTITFECHE